MRTSALNWVVALDGGTTNTRARLLHQGRVVATARRSVGVRDSVIAFEDRTPNRLREAAGEAIRDVLTTGGIARPDAVVASGMLTSDVGLINVPHVVAPAGLDHLAHAAIAHEMPEVCPFPILFIPGVRTPSGTGRSGWIEADVMRGEECETLGALGLDRPPEKSAFVWPGSHTKLVQVDELGQITQGFTTLAGEFLAALAHHTLLAASLPESLPEAPDQDAIAQGTQATETHGLGRAAFLVRIAALTGALEPLQRASFLIGAVVADDAANLARHAILRDSRRVIVGGREPLRTLYANALRSRLDRVVETLNSERAENAAAIGALAVATRRWELKR